jgi:hypothetical protein
MLSYPKSLMYGGGLFTSLAVFACTLPSEGVVCIDIHLLCAPPPLQMGDLPSEDGPQAPGRSPLTVTASASMNFTGSSLPIRTGWHW